MERCGRRLVKVNSLGTYEFGLRAMIQNDGVLPMPPRRLYSPITWHLEHHVIASDLPATTGSSAWAPASMASQPAVKIEPIIVALRIFDTIRENTPSRLLRQPLPMGVGEQLYRATVSSEGRIIGTRRRARRGAKKRRGRCQDVAETLNAITGEMVEAADNEAARRFVD